jgi:hypothetical protein
VSLGDLPFAADRPLVVTVAESNNSSFFYRRIPVESPIQQQEVYLLPRRLGLAIQPSTTTWIDWTPYSPRL